VDVDAISHLESHEVDASEMANLKGAVLQIVPRDVDTDEKSGGDDNTTTIAVSVVSVFPMSLCLLAITDESTEFLWLSLCWLWLISRGKV
jgi:hypothetical protein